MRILGNYVVFLISMVGMILAVNNDELNQFYTDLLDLHNKYRKKHYAEELILDDTLSQAAMRKAMNFGIDWSNSNLILGMNVFFEQHISKLNATDVFFYWYNQGEKYTHQDDPEMRSDTSSFTQIVWKSTKKMGVALYEGKHYVTLIVTYDPIGNIADQYMANVVTFADRKNDSSDSQIIKKQRTNDNPFSLNESSSE